MKKERVNVIVGYDVRLKHPAGKYSDLDESFYTILRDCKQPLIMSQS